MRIQWSEEFSVQMEELDTQHKKLFDILERLHEALETQKEKKEFALLLGEFIFYADYHFIAEEAYLEKIGYPEIDAHKEQHQRVKEKVKEFRENYNKGNYIITLDLSEFINGWIKQHILIEDQKYAKFLSEN